MNVDVMKKTSSSKWIIIYEWLSPNYHEYGITGVSDAVRNCRAKLYSKQSGRSAV